MAIIAVNTAQSLHIPFRRPCAGALLHSLQAVHLMQPCSQVPPHTASTGACRSPHPQSCPVDRPLLSVSPPPTPTFDLSADLTTASCPHNPVWHLLTWWWHATQLCAAYVISCGDCRQATVTVAVCMHACPELRHNTNPPCGMRCSSLAAGRAVEWWKTTRGRAGEW
jgi:hypothetical protein